jgi:alkanesulfonate monooxygenase SsuD/methylene tetrahydromethanopterin reductase-like flavin-dependent oxidoreductase (luciferase family)
MTTLEPSATSQLGLVIPPAAPPSSLWPAVECAEAGGIGSIWVTDGTLAAIPIVDSMTLLGAIAARTSRVRIGTSVMAIARRNPVLLAHAYATAQFLSGGRVVAGVGLGGVAAPAEYELCGMTTAQRAAVTDEYIPLLRRLWSGETVHHAGPSYSCHDVQLHPVPEVPIPIWVGGYTPAAYRRAGRFGDGFLSAMLGPDAFRAAMDQVHAEAVAVGRDPAAIEPGVYLFSAIGRRDGEAEAFLDPILRGIFGVGLDVMGDACLVGTPDQWVERIGRFGEAGARTVAFLLFTVDLAADVELVTAEVVPQMMASAMPLAGV